MEAAHRTSRKRVDPTTFHAEDEFTQKWNQRYSEAVHARETETGILLRQQQKAEKEERQYRRALITSTAAFLLAAGAVILAFISIQNLTSTPGDELTQPILNLALKYSFLAMVTVACSLLLFLRTIQLTGRVTEWWLTFIIMLLTSIQTMGIAYVYVKQGNDIADLDFLQTVLNF